MKMSIFRPKNEGEKFLSKNKNFSGELEFTFGKNILRTTTGEILSKILRAVLEISSLLGFWACPGKPMQKLGRKMFFSNAPNSLISKS